MEHGGFVSRTEYDENPPRIAYELTGSGRSVFCPWTRRATGRGRVLALLAARKAHGSG
nr:winged helix-turn-helix transcriptional regulator [Streptomyces sp. PKU-EA00015]